MFEKPENFWAAAREPLMVLAPMEDVTDTAFRELLLRISTPGQLQVLFSEFTSTDGLCHPAGRERVAHRLKVSEPEKELLRSLGVKLVAQVWGSKPEKYYQALKDIESFYAFDGVDINMGCPARKIVAQGGCSALIDNEPLAGEIIAAAREATRLPLSVKTRIGVKKMDTERWISFLLGQPVDALTIHGRTRRQMSEGLADWNEIAKAVKLRDAMAPHIRIIGNGDVESVDDGLQRCEKYGTDGVMIGRGIFKNPWLFSPERSEIPVEEKLEHLLLHIQLYESAWGGEKPFVILRRFFKIYLSDFDGAAALRQQLMGAEDYAQARQFIEAFKSAVFENS